MIYSSHMNGQTVLFFKKFLLEYSLFTMLCYFLLYSKLNQFIYIYLHSFLDSVPIWVITEYLVESLCYIVSPYWLSIFYI